MADDYGKFEGIKRKSLASLVDELSLISNIEHSLDSNEQMIKRAKNIFDEEIKTIEDLNKYYISLQEEINQREKIYLKGYEFYEVIKKLASKFPDFLK